MQAANGENSRRGSMARRRTVLIAAGAAAAGTITGGLVTAGAEPKANDAALLNSALVLEELQAAFYSEALRRARLRGELGQFAHAVGEHERLHVAYLRRLLGRRARAAPTFDFGDATASPRHFAETARRVEDLGVAAYDGQAPGLSQVALAAVARIVSVEARHAAWIRDILGELPAPVAANPAYSARQVEQMVARTGFVKGGGDG